MAVLVTGGSGFVGLNVIEALLGRGETVVAASLESVPPEAKEAFAALPGRLVETICDVRDSGGLARLIETEACDRVWHGAVVTAGTARERADAAGILDANIQGTLAALEAARRCRISRFVFASSAAVYGDAIYGEAALDEDTPAVPESLYAISKFACERLTIRFKQLWRLDAVCGRIGAVFGPWEWRTDTRDTMSQPYQVAHFAVSGREAVIVPGGARDWVYSRDVARAFDTLLHAPHCRFDVYNIAHGAVWNVEQWCRELSTRFSGFRYRVAADPAQATIAYYDQLDRTRVAVRRDRLADDLGYRPAFSLEAALGDYAAWTEAHADFLRRQPD